MEWKPKGGVFDFAGFIAPLNTNSDFTGNCEDVSALYAMCSEIVGVESSLTRTTGKAIREKGLDYVYEFFKVQPIQACAYGYNPGLAHPVIPPPWGRPDEFNLHQVVADSTGDHIWDPTFQFGGPSTPFFAIGRASIDYFNNVLAKQPTVIERWPVFRLEDVSW